MALDDYSPRKIKEQFLDAGYRASDRNSYSPVWYEADGYHRQWGADDEVDFLGIGKKRVSIHMPRWASRINLEVTGVRVERLNDISEEDAAAEGVKISRPYLGIDSSGTPIESDRIDWAPSDYYFELWQSIYGPDSWSLNPWVWVVEFKKLEAA